ncbi:MAG: adenylosuccinate synthase [Chordicoccus sp.]
MVTAVVGANWGDEGKGKVVDVLASQADVVIRFQGGANAGHTIKNKYGKFALHTLPSGVCHPEVMNIIGNGVALSVDKVVNELKDIESKGVPAPKLMISDRCQIVMSYHVLFDSLEEARLAGKSFGSTKSGIAPFYSDKFAKIGIQVSELEDMDALREKVEGIVLKKNIELKYLYHTDELKVDDIMAELERYKKELAPYVGDTSAYLYENVVKGGKTALLEGQLGTMKDPDHGIYPMVTSSSTLAGYGAVGAGIPPYDINRVVVVSKAYSSAVGAGEFVSEIFGDEAEELRRRGGDGGEYGATTGRPRRVGFYDTVASRYGVRLQGGTEVALTVLDCLSYLDEIPVCVGYELDGKVIKDFPTTTRLKRCKPVWTKLPGWKTDIRGIRKYEDLPENARKYVEFIEKEIGVHISMVSNGPAREDIIYR